MLKLSHHTYAYSLFTICKKYYLPLLIIVSSFTYNDYCSAKVIILSLFLYVYERVVISHSQLLWNKIMGFNKTFTRYSLVTNAIVYLLFFFICMIFGVSYIKQWTLLFLLYESFDAVGMHLTFLPKHVQGQSH